MAKTRHITGPQIITQPTNNEIFPSTEEGRPAVEDWRRLLLRMRRDPTISLVRALSLAPFFAAEWTTEETVEIDPEAVAFINGELQAVKLQLLHDLVLGTVDWGWQAFEIIREVRETEIGPLIGISKLKPLLQNITSILVDEDNGDFIGVRQINMVSGNEVDIDKKDLLYHAINVEGTDWYGEPTMLSAFEPWRNWEEINKSAHRYDAKIAGSHWLVYYPIGTSLYNGQSVDNAEIARDILNKLQSSGTMAIPQDVSQIVDDFNAAVNSQTTGWRIELLTDSGAGATAFTDRQKYMDVLKVRAFGFPERSILEGQFGTKAEAGEHGDFAISVAEMRHQMIGLAINKQIVNQLVRLNIGVEFEGKIKLVISPLVDAARAALSEIYKSILENQEIGVDEMRNVDVAALRDLMRIPSVSEPTEIGDIFKTISPENTPQDEQ